MMMQKLKGMMTAFQGGGGQQMQGGPQMGQMGQMGMQPPQMPPQGMMGALSGGAPQMAGIAPGGFRGVGPQMMNRPGMQDPRNRRARGM